MVLIPILFILISHLGWMENGMGDQEVIAKSRYIDIVLGGHSHTFMTHLEYEKNLDGKPVPVDQNGKHAVYVGKLLVNLE